MKLLKFVLIALSLALMPDLAEASITINSTDIYAIGYDAILSGIQSSFSGTTIPTSTTLNAIDGAAGSQNSIDWSTSVGQTTLSFDMDHYRAGTRFSNAHTFGSLNFNADSSDPYELSGYYNAAHVAANKSGIVYQYIQLVDQTAGSNLLYYEQQSISTHDEQFTLGSTGGDISNFLFGSLTGSLIAGHTYELNFHTFIQVYPNGDSDGDSGASAEGNFTLKIGETTSVVPEAASLFVWGSLTGLALGAVVIRQRRA